ncbi:tRNA 5-hydroxyuridine modification protein YegQ [Pleionea sediminis]|uniref:prephenate-dependent tRNA uridine(34) hydroxylase TrhP n=1 Tax=Pleionea sediminis TaxID=2569479 RepID=UPI001186AD75|nr:tRNA 5-hydroxyuridine modification protein YegQ [Pleionea sediminis]
MKRPELLSPAGTLKHMRYAFAYGADAVYAGQPRYSLRVRNNEFDHDNLKIGIDEAHAQGKQFFVCANIAPHNSKVKTFLRDLQPIVEMKPDAFIMSDPGLIDLVRENHPEMPIHLSVQMNTVNYASVKFWHKLGVERIILSRELSLDEIGEIRQECPDVELEVFVHGALCIAYSGRCLLSGYMNRRDPNQGTCTNACRWDYKVASATEDDKGNLVRKDETVKYYSTEMHQSSSLEDHPSPIILEEPKRAGEEYTAEEDEHGTYIFNSKDLRALQHVERLMSIGIDCLKIEGRTKSFYYAARTAQLYRQAIDDALQGLPFNRQLMDVSEGLANRGYTEGFYRRHVHDEYQNYLTGNSGNFNQQFVGEVLEQDGERILVDVKNRFQVGDSVELLSASGNIEFILDSIENEKGVKQLVAPGSGYRLWIRKPDTTAVEHGLVVRNLSQ